MRTRDKERLQRETDKMNQNSKNRYQTIKKMSKEQLSKLNIKEHSLALPALPRVNRQGDDLEWRKYKNTRRTRPYSRRKRILVVETIHKKNETYTISGINKAELTKVVEALK